MALNQIRIDPLGVVRSTFTADSGDKWSTVAELVLDKSYEDGLDGIEGYSHIIVLFWLDRIVAEDRAILEIHPRGRDDLPQVGVFATRGKVRPNPIGLAVVELLSRDGHILKVRGLDAFDGSPILDIKPYDNYDVKENIRVPEWWLKMTSQKHVKHEEM
jgi:tRNA-Thr(GGU) m(6)t(6)A37 methyltransferase TsaA